MARTKRLIGLCAVGLAVVATAAGVGARANESRVADAAMRGDAADARALLKQGADVNAAQGDGMTALHWAALRGDAELAQMLIYAGANLKSSTRLGGYTPMLVAAKYGQATVLEALAKAGANVNEGTTTGVTPLMLAAASGSTSSVSLLLTKGADVNAKETALGETALMFAAAGNHADVIKALMSKGADTHASTLVVDLSKATPPYDPDGNGGEADKDKEKDKEKAKDGDKDKGTEKDKEKEAKSDAAEPKKADEPKKSEAADAAKGEKPLAGQEGATRQAGNRGFQRSMPFNQLVGVQGGLTPLLFAARQGHVPALKALLESGADVNEVSKGDGSSALLVATINGKLDAARFLLERGADPNLASAAGATPLYQAINVQWAPHAFYPQPSAAQEKTGYLELVQALLERGADPNARLTKRLWYTGYNFNQSAVDEAGATPFWRAAQATDIVAMRLLADWGADSTIPTKVTAEPRLPNGRSANGQLADGQGGEKAPPPVQIGGPAVNALLAAAGAGWNANYHVNAPGGWMSSVKYLVEEQGFDVNAVDHKGYTAVHYAAARGDNEMILYLVSKGADVKIVANDGMTTVDMANGPVQRIQPFPETIALLEKMGAKNNHKCVSC